jgi:2,4-dienoyl-CoA reductase-like NADH-dependent reductase (Old Yellow Enzyme family)
MERLILRFSELKDDLPGYRWLDPEEEIEAYLGVFREVGLRVLHPSTNTFLQPISGGLTLHELVRTRWNGTLIGVGGLSASSATDAIRSRVIDLAAFGRPLLANPDFVQRLRTGMPLVPYDPEIHLKQLL